MSRINKSILFFIIFIACMVFTCFFSCSDSKNNPINDNSQIEIIDDNSQEESNDDNSQDETDDDKYKLPEVNIGL